MLYGNKWWTFQYAPFFRREKPPKLMNSSELPTSQLKSQKSPKEVWSLYTILTPYPRYVTINEWAAYKPSFIF